MKFNSYTGHEELTRLCSQRKKSELYLAHYLYNLKLNDNWREAVGEGGMTTWDDYLKQPEIGISKAKAEKLIQIYKGLVIDLHLPINTLISTSLSVLSKLWQGFRDGHFTIDEIKELLGDAEHLSLKDFKERFQDVKSKSLDRTYTYVLMKKCVETGNLEKVHDITHEQIKEALKL